MKLLILTQKIDVNDDLLGFFHAWAAEFAKHCAKLTIIALGAGEYDLPENVNVLSLGKESIKNRQSAIGNRQFIKRIKYLIRFYRYIIVERKNYDAVLVHMNAEYIILGGLIWRLLSKKIGLWYVHKRVDWKLRLAAKLADVIFTASPGSFRLASNKLKIIGHGIDQSKFNFAPGIKSGNDFKIIYVGRISAIKNQRLFIEAADILINQKGIKNVRFDLVGEAVYQEDAAYKEALVQKIAKDRLQDQIKFIGSVPHKDIAAIYQAADLSVNLCPTGGMDKAALESMAAGLPVIVLNKTFAFLGDICE